MLGQSRPLIMMHAENVVPSHRRCLLGIQRALCPVGHSLLFVYRVLEWSQRRDKCAGTASIAPASSVADRLPEGPAELFLIIEPQLIIW